MLRSITGRRKTDDASGGFRLQTVTFPFSATHGAGLTLRCSEESFITITSIAPAVGARMHAAGRV